MPRLKQDIYRDNFREIVIMLLKKIGKDFKRCEQCNEELSGKFVLHHTKYDGATIYDLEVICQRCNTQPENRFLQ